MMRASKRGFVVRLAAAARPRAHSHQAPGCNQRGIATRLIAAAAG